MNAMNADTDQPKVVRLQAVPPVYPVPQSAITFDLQAMVKSPFFWLTVGAGAMFWIMSSRGNK